MAPPSNSPDDESYLGEDDENGGWIPIASNPNLLSSWVKGDADNESLKEWLDSKYPHDVSESILDNIAHDVVCEDLPGPGAELKEVKEVKKDTIEFMNWSLAKKKWLR